MPLHPTGPEANEIPSPDGVVADCQIFLSPDSPSSSSGPGHPLLGPLLTPQEIISGDSMQVDQPSNQNLGQEFDPFEFVNFDQDDQDDQDHVGAVTSVLFSIPISSSVPGSAFTHSMSATGAGPNLGLRSATSIAFPNQDVLAQDLSRLNLYSDPTNQANRDFYLLVHGGGHQRIRSQEHLRIWTPPNDPSYSPQPAVQDRTPVVRSQAVFPRPVPTPPLGTLGPLPAMVPVVVRSQRTPGINTQAANTQAGREPELRSPRAVDPTFHAIRTTNPTLRPVPVVSDTFPSCCGSLFAPGHSGPSGCDTGSHSLPTTGMKSGATDGLLYMEMLTRQLEHASLGHVGGPVSNTNGAHQYNVNEISGDDDYEDDDDNNDYDDYDDYEVGAYKNLSDSGCDVGSSNSEDDPDDNDDESYDDSESNDNDEDGDDGDVAPQMSDIARGKQRADDGVSDDAPQMPKFAKGKRIAEPRCSLQTPSSSSKPDTKGTSAGKPKDDSNRGLQKDRIKCPLCPKSFDKQSELRRHLIVHNDPLVQCLNCDKKLSRGDAMKRHATSVRYRACLEFGWFVERDTALGPIPMAIQMDATSTSTPDASMTPSTGSSSSSPEESSLPERVTRSFEYGAPVGKDSEGNWYIVRKEGPVPIKMSGSYRVRACFPGWRPAASQTPRTPLVDPAPQLPQDPHVPRALKRPNKKQKEKIEDKKKRRDEKE